MLVFVGVTMRGRQTLMGVSVMPVVVPMRVSVTKCFVRMLVLVALEEQDRERNRNQNERGDLQRNE
ncbi:MAG: hypothetical protein AAF368_03580, partial [Planctomycetota bacterium]